MTAQPDDGGDLGFDAGERVGPLRDQIRPALGEGIAERGGPALDALPVGFGGFLGAGKEGKAAQPVGFQLAGFHSAADTVRVDGSHNAEADQVIEAAGQIG